MRNKLTILLRRLARHGLLGSLKLIPTNIRWAWRQLRPSNLAERRRERALDREFAMDTAGNMTKGALQAETETAGVITFYQPVPLRIFDEMTGCLPSDLSSFCFIDIGSGKGRALVLAARLGFNEIIGVEFSPTLHRTAEKNLVRLRNSTSTIIHNMNIDALSFEFPTMPTVVFFGNPFGDTMTRQVIQNIERAHLNSNFPVFFLYHWPVHKQALEERGTWQEISRGAWRKDFGFEWRDYALVTGQRQ